jgi:hypothetical protein
VHLFCFQKSAFDAVTFYTPITKLDIFYTHTRCFSLTHKKSTQIMRTFFMYRMGNHQSGRFRILVLLFDSVLDGMMGQGAGLAGLAVFGPGTISRAPRTAKPFFAHKPADDVDSRYDDNRINK